MNDFIFRSEAQVTFEKARLFFSCCASHDVDFEKTKATVDWELEFDARDRGIKSINVMIRKITCIATWSVPNEELTSEEIELLVSMGGKEYKNDCFEGQVDIDTTKLFRAKQWTIEHDLTFSADGGLMIDEITIDFETNIIHCTN